ncbi:alpha/beta hydrolase [Nocardioides sp. CER19]|uniref:alpha/beta hydrolase n=1 Tax=Nocardioides sp. CER19 TaxID=3038538 RepID=UPI002449EDB0|nr:alpha/beta hydrolase [Nocardioides sp. CER19]MDH2413325.1 alpha/beta hydrolase [Nocardioides sp. CER19]
MSLFPTRSSARSLLSSAAAVAERRVFTTALRLPQQVQRRLAGKPVVVDGQPLATDTQLMLRLAKVAGPAVESLPIPQGRTVLLHQSRMAGGEQPISMVRMLSAAGHRARLYTPGSAPHGPGPLLVFFHGGGFVYGDLDSHDASVRFLAEQSGVRVLAVEYRLAPEAPFPAAYDDALEIFRWVLDHAAEVSAEPGRIGVGGDSAGGNLAAGVALEVTEACAFQLLIYPVTQFDEETESRRRFRTGYYLTSDFIDVAGTAYVPAGTDPRDPRLSPLYAEVPSGVAPAFVATAGFDPLRDEGEAYAGKLAAAGVEVEAWRYADQIHGFFNVLAARTSRAAVLDLADALRKGLRA